VKRKQFQSSIYDRTLFYSYISANLLSVVVFSLFFILLFLNKTITFFLTFILEMILFYLSDIENSYLYHGLNQLKQILSCDLILKTLLTNFFNILPSWTFSSVWYLEQVFHWSICLQQCEYLDSFSFLCSNYQTSFNLYLLPLYHYYILQWLCLYRPNHLTTWLRYPICLLSCRFVNKLDDQRKILSSGFYDAFCLSIGQTKVYSHVTNNKDK